MNLHKHHPTKNPHASKWAARPVAHPAGPRKGDLFFVQGEMRHWGDVFTIRQVNRRSFYFYRFGMGSDPGTTLRRLVVEWEQWIDELFEKGFVFCNGIPLLPPARLTPRDPEGAAECERRKRIDQAVEQARLMVLESPVGEPVREGDENRFAVTCGDGPAATVFVPDDSDKPVRCSCTMSRNSPLDSGGTATASCQVGSPGPAGPAGPARPVCPACPASSASPADPAGSPIPCRHIFAVLVGRAELAHRLLEFLL